MQLSACGCPAGFKLLESSGNLMIPIDQISKIIYEISCREEDAQDNLIVNLWAMGRNTSEVPPWSIADFRTYVDNLTGSRSAFDGLWHAMQRSLGATLDV